MPDDAMETHELDVEQQMQPVPAAVLLDPPPNNPMAKWAFEQTAEPRTDVVPGRMRCAKCKFVLTRVTLAVNLGRAIAGTNQTEPCPNGCGPLWPQTWEQEARECWTAMEQLFDRAIAAEKALESRPSATVLTLAATPASTDDGDAEYDSWAPLAPTSLDKCAQGCHWVTSFGQRGSTCSRCGDTLPF